MTEVPDPWTIARELDQRVRAAAFDFLRAQTGLRGEVLRRDLLAEGFRFDGQRVPLIGPQGIFKPAILPEMPLTITTVPVVEGHEPPTTTRWTSPTSFSTGTEDGTRSTGTTRACPFPETCRCP